LTLKQKIYNQYLLLLTAKINAIQKVLADLKESGANETKSTAGDKHETALAMIQIEQANTMAQLEEMVLQKTAFEKIDPGVSSSSIVTGSLVYTNRGVLYLSVALGKAVVDDIIVTALSRQSPLGQQLLGLSAGDKIVINNHSFVIEAVE
jgi:transcription elongation GreA/GreB family factor